MTRNTVRLVALLLKTSDGHPVALLDHLIKEKIVPVCIHLADYGMILAEPRIDLFRSGRIKSPLPFRSAKFWPYHRVAMGPAHDVRFFVLTLEVEDVHRKCTVGEVVAHVLTAVLEETPYVTILIMPVNTWDRTLGGE